MLSGLLAVVWLLLRSGPKPGRLAYPCQQAAFTTAAAAFGAPVVMVLVSLRRHLAAALRSTTSKIAVCSSLAVGMVMLAIGSVESEEPFSRIPPPEDYRADVYLVNDVRGVEPGRFGGVDDLITLMGTRGLKWHRSPESGLTSGPDGLIGTEDVVLIKVNSQWPQRGGTNTDVLRGVIRRVVEHPDGFGGEVIVADNGQGSGSLDRIQNNAEDHEQSAKVVVDDFDTEGWIISTFRWDDLYSTSVAEYDAGDLRDGYIVSADPDPETQIRVSYPKFRSSNETYVSYKHGIWSPATETYDPDKLVVINIPVLKTHSIYAVTAAVKNHMGVVTRELGTDAHAGVGRGGLGSVLAGVRRPDLNILDCIWILARPGYGPPASYEAASRRDQLVASRDPVALDVWAAKNIMIPQIIENGYTPADYSTTQDPDNPGSDFRQYLDRSMNELLLAGIDVTNEVGAVDSHVWVGDVDRDGDVDPTDFRDVAVCLTGPDTLPVPDCLTADFDDDEDADLSDFAMFQRTFTGTRP